MKQRLFLALLPVLIVSTTWAQVYTVTDLGPLSPTAVNTWGQVVGNLDNHAFLWTRTQGLKPLGTMRNGTFSRATAINDMGVAAGEGDGPITLKIVDFLGNTEQVVCNGRQAFVWNRSKGMRGLGIIQVGNASDYYQGYIHFGCNLGKPVTYAAGINIFGQIVGTNDWSSNTFVDGFSWTRIGISGVAEDNSYQTRIAAINNLGQFVGARSSNILFVDSHPHAALWHNNSLTDLGTLAGGDPSDPLFFSYCSEANGINDLGQTAGWSTTMQGPNQIECSFSPIHAVLWSGGGIEDLGTLPGDTSSMAYALNSLGQVIGSSGATLYWDSEAHMYKLAGRPFVWTQHSGIHDLNSLIDSNSGWILNSATAINIWGQIVGTGTRNGQPHGFLLTPRVLFR